MHAPAPSQLPAFHAPVSDRGGRQRASRNACLAPTESVHPGHASLHARRPSLKAHTREHRPAGPPPHHDRWKPAYVGRALKDALLRDPGPVPPPSPARGFAQGWPSPPRLSSPATTALSAVPAPSPRDCWPERRASSLPCDCRSGCHATLSPVSTALAAVHPPPHGASLTAPGPCAQPQLCVTAREDSARAAGQHHRPRAPSSRVPRSRPACDVLVKRAGKARHITWSKSMGGGGVGRQPPGARVQLRATMPAHTLRGTSSCPARHRGTCASGAGRAG